MFAFRSPVKLRPGQSVTLRYAYGTAHAAQIPGIVSRWRARRCPLRAQPARLGELGAQGGFSGHNAWLSRELAWDAYMLRSGATYEEACGHHIISQGGYYQYDFGWQAAFRDPLQHILPLIYTAPGLAREVLRYSAQEQTGPAERSRTRWARCAGRCRGHLGRSRSVAALAAAEYGLASRDLPFSTRR